MVYGEPWDLQEIGSMVIGLPGVTGGKNTVSVAPFSVLFLPFLHMKINPEMTCNQIHTELTSTTNKRNNLSFHQLICCR